MKLQPQVVLFLQHGNSSSGQPGQLPELQLHAPLEHTRWLAQTLVHEPQWLVSLDSFTHAPLQFV
jgi:hypothetical protein